MLYKEQEPQNKALCKQDKKQEMYDDIWQEGGRGGINSQTNQRMNSGHSGKIPASAEMGSKPKQSMS